MASNRATQTVYPALQPDSSYGPSGVFLAGSGETMARSDSGYMSNLSNRPGYYGDPNSVLQEEVVEDYQGQGDEADVTMAWHQYNMTPMDPTTYDEQLSNYMVEGTGSHMATYYQEDSQTPRTTYVDTSQPYQDMDLDEEAGVYLKQEHWPSQLDGLPHYGQETYQDQTLSPTQDDEMLIPYYDMSALPSTMSHSDPDPASNPGSNPTPTTATTKRQRLPSATPSTTSADGRVPVVSVVPSQGAITTSPSTATPTQPTKFPCLMPNCGKQFNRMADLDRHQKFIHYKSSVRAYACDYRRCRRHKEPFHRADHFRDHLRDQHKEDLLKRGDSQGSSSAGAGKGEATGGGCGNKWWLERSPSAAYGGWWRCSKCFVRVVVGREGWQCGSCGNYCEGERQGVRRLPRVCEYEGCAEASSHAGVGGEDAEGAGAAVGANGEWTSPAAFREHLRVVHGEDVPVKEGKEGDRELADEGWWERRSLDVLYGSVWRCTRCLEPVDSTVDGVVCSGCGFRCEEARRVRRGWS